jgi:hypothetical protein
MITKEETVKWRYTLQNLEGHEDTPCVVLTRLHHGMMEEFKNTVKQITK